MYVCVYNVREGEKREDGRRVRGLEGTEGRSKEGDGEGSAVSVEGKLKRKSWDYNRDLQYGEVR